MLGQINKVMESQKADQAKLQQQVAQDFSTARWFAWSGLAVALLVGALCAFGLTRTIAGAVQAMTRAMQTLAQGDTKVEIPARGRGDEIGAMAAAVQVFKENAIERIRLEAEQAAENEAKEKRTRAIEQLIGDFDGSDGVRSCAPSRPPRPSWTAPPRAWPRPPKKPAGRRRRRPAPPNRPPRMCRPSPRRRSR